MKHFWNPERKKELSSFLKQYKNKEEALNAAAQYFDKTYASVEMAARRLKEDLYKKKGKRGPKAGVPRGPYKKTTSVVLKDNPFEIMDDILYTGNRGNYNNEMASALLQQIMKLTPGDVRMSVNIPTTVCPNKQTASNLVLAVRRLAKESSNKEIQKLVVTLKTITTGSKSNEKYVGTRIWRRS